jgi:hypothetical protein
VAVTARAHEGKLPLPARKSGSAAAGAQRSPWHTLQRQVGNARLVRALQMQRAPLAAPTIFRQPVEHENDQYECVIRQFCDAPVPAAPGAGIIGKVNEQCRRETGYGDSAPDIEPTQWECQPPEKTLQLVLEEIDDVERQQAESRKQYESGGGRGDVEEVLEHLRQRHEKLIDSGWRLCTAMKTPDECRRIPAFHFKGNVQVAGATVPAAAVVAAAAALYIATQTLLSLTMRDPRTRERVNDAGETLTWPPLIPIPFNEDDYKDKEPETAPAPERARPVEPSKAQPAPPEPEPVPVGPSPVPVPPRPDDDDQPRRRCTVQQVEPKFGRYPCHSDFAKTFSGTRREFLVTDPQGIGVSFDAKRGNVLYEVKTGYGWMLNQNLGPDMQRRKDEVIERFHEQAAYQVMVATRCGYELDWYFNSESVAKFFESLLEPPVRWKIFDCDKDSDHTW